MTKYSVVQEGKTPSVLSGKPSEKITEEGEAIKNTEKLRSTKHLQKIASQVVIKKK